MEVPYDNFDGGSKNLNLVVYRQLYDHKFENWQNKYLENGFETLEEAEWFMTEFMDEFDVWTIVTEYRKR